MIPNHLLLREIPLKITEGADGRYLLHIAIDEDTSGGGGANGTQALADSTAMNDTSATLYAGTLSTTTSAAALAASQAVREVIVQSDPDNTTDILVGNASAQTIQLKPGQSLVIPVSNLASVYAKSVSGTPTLNYLGRS